MGEKIDKKVFKNMNVKIIIKVVEILNEIRS